MTNAGSSAPTLASWVAPDPEGGEGGYLVALGVEPPLAGGESPRPPVDLVLAIDRSSSMVGSRIAAAVEAARQVCLRLDERDRVGVVAFDAAVQTVRRPGPATASTASEVAVALAELGVGYGTNLSAAWERAAELIVRGGVPGAGKSVLIFTDGLPSRGEMDVDELVGLVAAGKVRGVATSTVGIGERFDEVLLAKMAVAAGGSFRYAERDEDTPAIADEEVDGLLGLVAESAVLHVGFAQAVKQYEVVHDLTCRTDGDGLAIELGRLFAGRPRSVLLHISVEKGTRHLGAVGLSCAGGTQSSYDGEMARILLPAPGQEASDEERVGAVYVPLRVARRLQQVWDCGRDADLARLQAVIDAGKREIAALPAGLKTSEEAQEAVARFTAAGDRITASFASDLDEAERRSLTASALKSVKEDVTLVTVGGRELSSPVKRRRGWGKR